MSVQIESPEGVAALTEFVQFYDQVYEYRDARWSAALAFQVPVLTGESPFAQERKMRPFLARAGGRLLARAVAVVDDRYNQHWQERLGHLSLFEALPDTREATQLLIDAACDWLKAQGMEAARAGFGLLDFPFAIDDYTSLPPSRARQNPAYYHQLLKDAGFESEKGCVDYKIAVRPELMARWENALEGGPSGRGRDHPAERRTRQPPSVRVYRHLERCLQGPLGHYALHERRDGAPV